MILPPIKVPQLLVRENIDPLIIFLQNAIGRNFVNNILKEQRRAYLFGVTLETPHPFAQGIFDWKKFSRTGQFTKELIRVSAHAAYIYIFNDEWKNPPQRQEFLDRLRDRHKCSKLLFELQIGFHYLLAGYPVELVFNDIAPGKKLDLKVHHKNVIVGIECTRKDRKLLRWESSEALVEDLLRTVEEKAEGGYDFQMPRILCIQIPEVLPVLDMDIREQFGRRLQGRFEKESKYNSISMVIISANDDPVELAFPGSSSLFSMKPMNLGYYNPHSKYKLADLCPDLRVALP